MSFCLRLYVTEYVECAQCIYTCVCRCLCLVYTCGGQKKTMGVLLCPSLPCFLQTALSLSLDLSWQPIGASDPPVSAAQCAWVMTYSFSQV